MVYKLTNFNPLSWWRPVALVLGLLIFLGSTTDVLAQPCSVVVDDNDDGVVTIPDGTNNTTVVFNVVIELSDGSGGDATIDKDDVVKFFSSDCNYYFFDADNINDGDIDDDDADDSYTVGCSDRADVGDDGILVFVRIDSDDEITTSDKTFAIRITAINDVDGPMITAPGDVTIDCSESRIPSENANLDEPDETDYEDNCSDDDDIEIDYVDDAGTIVSVGVKEFIRTWRATDESDNVGEDTQTITVEDDEDPEFTNRNGVVRPTLTGGVYNYGTDPNIYETCEDNVPTYRVFAQDNCGTPVITMDQSSSRATGGSRFSQVSYYNYEVTLEYTATDGFDREAEAQRIVRFRDTKAPIFASIHPSLSTPVRGDEDTPDEYEVTGTINLNPNTNNLPCTASVTFTLDADDANSCTPKNLLSYSYSAVSIDDMGRETFFDRGNFNVANPTINDLVPGTDYRVRIMVADVVGNTSYVDVNISVARIKPRIVCSSAVLPDITLDNLGEARITARDILGAIPDQRCNFNELTFEIQDTADGLQEDDGEETDSGDGDDLTDAAALAFVDFDCSDANTTRTIQVRIVNNNGGEEICTRQVRIVPGNSGNALSASFSAVRTTSPTATDGRIDFLVSGGTAPYTFSYRRPNGGAIVRVTGQPANTSLGGLASGTYNVSISSDNGCSAEVFGPIYVPFDDPIELFTTCPQTVTNGTINIPIRVRDFNGMNSTEFTVTLSGGLRVVSATADNLPANTSVNIVNNNKVTFSWFLQNMNTTPSVTLNDGTTILNIQAQAPSTPRSYSVSIDGSVTAVSATQNQGAGAAASTTVSVDFNSPLCSGSVIDSPASVSGNINFFSPNGSGVNGVSLQLVTNSNTINSTTNATGNYSVQADPNSSVTLTPARPHSNQTQLLDGVNGGDLVQIQRRILGLSNTLSGNPYKTIAADANGNNTVDGGDLVRIQRAILGLETSFAVPAWRFVQTSQTFANPNNPFGGLQESYTNSNLNSAVTVNFIGIKVGDVDCSATYPYKLTSEGGSEKATNADIDYRGVLPIQVKDSKLEAGELHEVKFTAQDFRDMLTYQTTIEFDPNVLQFIDLHTNDALMNLNEASFGLSKATEGMITTLWYNAVEQSLVDGTEVFTLRFRAKEDNILSRVLRFTSNGIPQMAMGKDFETFNIDLNFENTIKPADKFDLNQNRPNPFGDETTITFELTEGGVAILAIMDVNGRVVRTYQENFAQGFNEIKVNRTDVPSTGVYFYQLTTATQQSAIRKMIIVD